MVGFVRARGLAVWEGSTKDAGASKREIEREREMEQVSGAKFFVNTAYTY